MMKHYSKTLLAASLGLAVNLASAGNAIDLKTKSNWDVIVAGATDFAKLGSSMASGDFNGDGIRDLAIGAPGEDSPRGVTDTGAVSVFFGGSNFQSLIAQSTTSSAVPALTGAGATFFGAASEYAGDKLATGDLNGDGINDLIVVAQKNGNYTKNTIYVIYGGAQFSGTLSAAVTIKSPTQGMHVSGLATGDVNGDGIDDLVIADDYKSQIYVAYGSKTLAASIDISSSASALIQRSSGSVFSPKAVTVFDFNGDGKKDIAIGAPTESDSTMSLSEIGRTFVRYGTGNNLPANLDIDSNMNLTIQGGLNKERSGERLTFGDMNGDGIADLIMGAPSSEKENVISTTGFGKVRVVFGKSTFPAKLDLYDQADMTLRLTDYGSLGYYLGHDIQAADVNKDGISDLIISAPYAKFSSSQNGWIFVVYGSRSPSKVINLENANLWIQAPDPVHSLAGGGMGYSISAGDYNNDGKIDIAAGAFQGSYLGKVAPGWAMVILNPADKVGSADYIRVMNWAETLLPNLLPASGRQELEYAPYKIRYYAATGTYVGFNPDDSKFYGFNPTLWGPNIVPLGSLADFLNMAIQAGF